MNLKTISVIAMDNRDFPDLSQKLKEAIEWVRVASEQKSQLAIFPEYLNQFCGDGPGNPRAMPLPDIASSDWQKDMTPLIEAAMKYRMDLVIPVLHQDNGRLFNSLFLIEHEGRVAGRYDKTQPTEGELEQGVVPGVPAVLEWRGIKAGAAICFDTNFENIFSEEANLGAQMFIVSSLWPGGSALSYYATKFIAPVCLSYPAWSRIIDIDGTDLAAGGYRMETLRFGFGFPVYTAALNFDRMVFHGDYNAFKVPDIQKKYGRNINISFSQIDARWCIESRSEEITVKDIADEFELIEVRNYLRRFQTGKAHP